MPATITLRNVYKHYLQGTIRTQVLKGVTVSFEQGHTYAIRGVSGTGKSTLMHIVGGLENPDAGSVFYNDIDVATFSPAEKMAYHQRVVGMMFQQAYLMRELTVLENVMLPPCIAGASIAKYQERAVQLLRTAGIIEKMTHMPATLSGGQQQRVALVRALMNGPAFLLADEPTGSLDEATGHAIIDLLRTCQKEWNIGIIVSTHDDYVANAMERVYYVENGVLVPSR